MRVPNQKTPDFRVFKGGALEFYCEVKELTDTDPLEGHLDEASGIMGPQISDGKSPTNRLIRKIGEAAAQFKCVNPDRNSLNVLAVVNTYDGADPDDLAELLRGVFRTESGRTFPIDPQFLVDRVQQLIWEIDLYWWIDCNAFTKTPKHRWASPHAEDSPTFLKLKGLLRMDGHSSLAQT